MRSQWMLGSCAALMAVAVAACDSTVDTSTGTGGQGGHGGQVPVECAVETSAPAPYAVTFQFENPGAAPAFLSESCSLEYQVSSCADGYTEPLSRSGACSADCGDPQGGCIQCGPCPSGSIAIQGGGQHTDSWSGHYFTFHTNAEGCSCHVEHDAPAGRYRITVPVYASDADVQNGTPGYEAAVDFELPAPGGVVTVPVAMPAP